MSSAHVLLVMLQQDEEAASVLMRAGIGEPELIAALREPFEEPPRALDLAFERAARLADGIGDTMLRPAHLLLAMTKDSRCAAHRCLEVVGQGAAAVRHEARRALNIADETAAPVAPQLRRSARSSARAPGPARTPTPPRARRSPRSPSEDAMRIAIVSDEVSVFEPVGENELSSIPANDAGAPWVLDPETCPLLSSIGRNLTDLARRGAIDPVIGRDAEIEQVLDALAKRRANNPMLVGAPGVGKTAVVEGVALRIAREVGSALADTIIVEVSAGALVSGTSVRGALAERMRRLREEVQQAEGRILLFIDEIHAVMGGGEGPDDLAQELKSTLARGELTCIGATTEAEYRKHFEKDPALARRFSAIRIHEPSPEVSKRILLGLSPKYEAHHRVAYEPDALIAAVDLSVRYLSEKQLPDKAIAVMDLAAARARRRGASSVDVAQIAHVVAEQAMVPVDRILERDADRLLRLESQIEARVVGHEAVRGRIANALRKSAAGFRGRRPLGTFLLLGPTGVGKTEMAKAIAEILFPGGAMTRLDMSEFSEAHAVARLLGAPPGYIGHDDGGQLTEPARKRPYQLILLDEVEKAHPDVLLALLPLLDEGRLTDARGRVVDFTNTVIFMTSNLGADVASVAGRIGFGHGERKSGTDENKALDRARAAMPPELWNRIDEPLYFHALGEGDVREIAHRMLEALASRIADERGVGIEFDPSAIDLLIENGGFDPVLGARPMRRTIGRLIEAPLAERLLSGSIPRGARMCVRALGGALEFDLAAEAAE
jgi:ATP-dependent Clp protease ATP-binding subunit ClpC